MQKEALESKNKKDCTENPSSLSSITIAVREKTIARPFHHDNIQCKLHNYITVALKTNFGAIAEYPAHQMSYLKRLPTRSAVPKSMNEKKSVKG